MRVASRNCTLAHIPRFEKMADNVARTKIVFTGLPEGYQTSFWPATHEIFIISSIADKKDESKCPLLPVLAGSRVALWLGCLRQNCLFATPPNRWTSQDASPHPRPMLYNSFSSSSSSDVRSLRRKRCPSNYLMGTAKVPFKSLTLEKSLSPLAPSTSTSRWVQVDS